MTKRMRLMHEITRLKKELIKTAKSNQYNFNHPEVVHISKHLDHLIIQLMREDRQRESFSK